MSEEKKDFPTPSRPPANQANETGAPRAHRDSSLVIGTTWLTHRARRTTHNNQFLPTFPPSNHILPIPQIPPICPKTLENHPTTARHSTEYPDENPQPRAPKPERPSRSQRRPLAHSNREAPHQIQGDQS